MAPLMVGQSIGLIKDVPTCRELLERMARDCTETLERVGRMTGAGR
jgi:nitronate monooxygenase